MTQLLSCTSLGENHSHGTIVGTQVGQPQSGALPYGDPVQRRLVSLRSSRQFFEAALQRGQIILSRWCNAQK
jgi:hypothetical protein